MKTYLDCLPCLVRQTIEATRIASDDETVRDEILREVTRALADVDFEKPPPLLGGLIHRMVRRATGRSDPYRAAKDECNEKALRIYPEMRALIVDSPDPLETAVRLAIAGNVIDFGTGTPFDAESIHDEVKRSLSKPILGESTALLRSRVEGARRILILGDNAGEIAFDRLLVEQLPLEKVVYAVRGSPTVNDATREDAERVGLTDLVEVIDNGSDIPATVLGACSESFGRRFHAADLIISKGQGNYEALSEDTRDIFFLFMVKCPVVSQHIGRQPGDLMMMRRRSTDRPERTLRTMR